MHRGDGQAIGAYSYRVDFFVSPGGDGADLVRLGGIGTIKDVDLAGARVDGEDALERGVLQHVIHDVGMRGWAEGKDERGSNAERCA